ncbi:beta-ketoacyl synthase chain length factor [bacterium]|nr:beta-ketoacyl synthase chain length factor [bacterium]
MKDNILEFYVNKFDYAESTEAVDISFIPPIMRRRLSKLDKCTLSVLNKTFTDDIQNIVFSSQYGEFERLIKIITQYTEDKEVSPNTFSGSVHNYPVGFFLLNNKKSVPYNAVASGRNSISSGLLAAVISDYNNILYCYADPNGDDFRAFAINISKNPLPQSQKFRITTGNKDFDDNFDDYIKLFNKDKNIINTQLFAIESVGGND